MGSNCKPKLVLTTTVHHTLPGYACQIAYGNIYDCSFSGITYCYNDLTGNIVWTYGNGGAGNSTTSTIQTPYGDYPTFINAIGNGVIYLVTSEHTITDPIYKGAVSKSN